jgi:hypothetical protein
MFILIVVMNYFHKVGYVFLVFISDPKSSICCNWLYIYIYICMYVYIHTYIWGRAYLQKVKSIGTLTKTLFPNANKIIDHPLDEE